VQVWDAGVQIQDMSAAHDAKAQRGKRLPQRPMHMHAHSTEGYALDWSSVAEGRLASGDCRRGIHVWEPSGKGSWTVSGTYEVWCIRLIACAANGLQSRLQSSC